MCSIYVMTNFFMQELFGNVNVIEIGDIPAFALRENPIRGLNGIIKTLEDYILSAIILLLISPILLIISLAIKLTSPGSVLFTGNRRFESNCHRLATTALYRN